jgi:hypothetical protein
VRSRSGEQIPSISIEKFVGMVNDQVQKLA